MVIDITPYCNPSRSFDLHKLACIIANKTYPGNSIDEPIILHLGYEGFDIVETGIEQGIKDIVDILRLDPARIIFRTNDRLTKSNFFKHEFCDKQDIFRNTGSVLAKADIEFSFPNTMKYGMFLVRANNERLYSFWKHKTWNFAKDGIATFHFDPKEFPIEPNDFTSFQIEHNDKWQHVKNLLPYNDMADMADMAESVAKNKQNSVDLETANPFWNNVYKDITVEVVMETNTAANTFFITDGIII